MNHEIGFSYRQSFLIQGWLLVGGLILVLAQTGCTPVSANPELPATATPPIEGTTSLVFPTDSPISPLVISPSETPLPTSLPVQSPIPRYTVEPLVTSPSPGTTPFFDSWAPNSEWIAFWFAEFGEEAAPASLAFIQVDTGEICLHPEVVTKNVGDGRVRWGDNGHTIVVPNPPEKEVLTGTPCGLFLPAEPLPSSTPGELSPDGRYLAATTSGLQGPGPIPFTTTISALETGQIVANITWEFGRGDANGGGPRWINNEIYLIGPALNQGFLYYSVPDGKVGTVISDLMMLDPTYSTQYRSIFSQVDPFTGEYHLLMKWEGGPTPLPLLLYHSEHDALEEIPFYSAWPFSARGWTPGFSPDGEWLLLGDPVGDEPFLEKIGGDYWLRPVDPPGSEAVQIARGMFPAGLSSGTQKMAFSNGEFVDILAFPSGEFLSRWVASNYEFQIHTLEWAPDGRRFVVAGVKITSNQTALFVVEP